MFSPRDPEHPRNESLKAQKAELIRSAMRLHGMTPTSEAVDAWLPHLLQAGGLPGLLSCLRRGEVLPDQDALPRDHRPIGQRRAYAGALRLLRSPGTMKVGTTSFCEVEVVNDSIHTWRGGTDSPVRAAYHWLDAKGQVVQRDGLRTPLPQDVVPGGSCRAHIKVLAPRSPGSWQLQLSLVHEGVCWFEEQGFAALVLPVVVDWSLPRSVARVLKDLAYVRELSSSAPGMRPVPEVHPAAKSMSPLTETTGLFRLQVRTIIDRSAGPEDPRAAQALLALAESALGAQRQDPQPVADTTRRKPRLAFVSPLPPEQTGIAYYSAELIPHLGGYYDIDVVSDQATIADAWIARHCRHLSVQDFESCGPAYDRVVYQIGNSRFHADMWRLMERIPGLAVIHDVFLGDCVAYQEDALGVDLALPREMYEAHGYPALLPLFANQGRAEAIARFPCGFAPVRESLGLVVHSRHAHDLLRHWYGQRSLPKVSVIPHPRAVVAVSAERRLSARRRLGISSDAFLICSFGVLNGSKQPELLLQAWRQCKLREDPRARLVYVGGAPDELALQLQAEVARSTDHAAVHFTGWADVESFQDYLAAADTAVQLRRNSRGESSGTVLDCMAHGLPTLCNAHGSFAELPADCVWMLDDPVDVAALAQAMDTLWSDRDLRQRLGQSSQAWLQEHHTPAACAQQYHTALEAGAYRQPRYTRMDVVGVLAHQQEAGPEDDMRLAQAIALTLPLAPPQRQLLVDVSVVAESDLRTGVQRVVRSILLELLKTSIPGFRVEPVYSYPEMNGYFYARDYTQRLLGAQAPILPDEPMEAHCGDIFLGLDLHSTGIVAQQAYLESLQLQGVQIDFVVHDLLPVTHPRWFPGHEEHNFLRWLDCITRFHGCICVSGATAAAVQHWLQINAPQRLEHFKIGVVHNGADIDRSAPTSGLPMDARDVLDALHSRPSFLMVGTVEPRKGVHQVLAAFDRLWARQQDFSLVIVGKRGWNVQALVTALDQHGERRQRLFWLESVSDEFLENIYAHATCLIAASEGEGFGLPLIEAARHGVPVLARDLPVFREVAGTHVEYFSAQDPDALSEVIADWHARFRSGRHVPSSGMPFLTWQDSARAYIDLLTGGGGARWLPPDA